MGREVKMDDVIKFVINIIECEADITDMICYENNFKGKLMKECHQRKWLDVKYLIDVDENAEQKLFNIKAECGPSNNKYIGYGKGKSKRRAQQKAAKDILIQLGKIINDNIDDKDDYFSLPEG